MRSEVGVCGRDRPEGAFLRRARRVPSEPLASSAGNARSCSILALAEGEVVDGRASYLLQGGLRHLHVEALSSACASD